MKNMLCTVVGLVGSWLASLFGGWDTALSTLLIFMAVDYVTGLVVAGVFHRSKKTDTGKLESRAGWKGLCRKGASLPAGYRNRFGIYQGCCHYCVPGK